MLGTGQDITERKRTIEERDRLLADERQAREFRDAFVDVISHELRTPITTILGLTEILARPGRTDDDATRAALLDDVRAESERLHRLTEDLLVLSRVERGRLEVDAEPLELRRLLEGIIAHEAAQPADHRHRDRARGRAADRRRGGDVRRADRPQPAGQRREIHPGRVSGRRVGATCRRRGRDPRQRRGPGIPDSSMDRIFELFYRDPDSARTVAGSGIGLFVCASLVEAMGGRIWAARRPEGGSEFGFTMRALEPGRRRRTRTERSSALRGRAGRSCPGRSRVRGSPWPPWPAPSPQRARATSVAAAMCGGSISNSVRSASRVSLRPNPSVPERDVVRRAASARPCPAAPSSSRSRRRSGRRPARGPSTDVRDRGPSRVGMEPVPALGLERVAAQERERRGASRSRPRSRTARPGGRGRRSPAGGSSPSRRAGRGAPSAPRSGASAKR